MYSIVKSVILLPYQFVYFDFDVMFAANDELNGKSHQKRKKCKHSISAHSNFDQF